jgi:thiol-disulfide isomerase/thioredoxin
MITRPLTRLISRLGVRRSATLVVVTVVAAVGIVAWRNDFWSAPPVDRAAQESSGGEATTGLTRYPAGGRSGAPDLRGKTLDGDRLAVADLRGHVVVMNMWGSWCQPCRKEAPDLARVARETSSRGVRFVGIGLVDDVLAETTPATAAASALAKGGS